MAQGSLELGRALRAIECSRQSSDECQWMVAWEKSMKSVLQEMHDDKKFVRILNPSTRSRKTKEPQKN